MNTAKPAEYKTKPAIDKAADLTLLMDAVRDAGEIALRYFGNRPQTQTKKDGTDVSEADLAVDRALNARLMTTRPGYGWLSEESEDDRTRLERNSVWVIDPIDGTRAFLKEKPEWTISAALVEAGQPVLAVVYNLATGKLFHASSGGGAWLNGEPATVAEPVTVEGSRLIVSRGLLNRDIWERAWPPLETTWVNSVAYRLALVSAGKCDGTLSLSNKNDRDLAAAHLLVQEAGGKVTTHTGGTIRYNGPSPLQQSVVAACTALHAELVERTGPARI